jgi:hypothetical protein
MRENILLPVARFIDIPLFRTTFLVPLSAVKKSDVLNFMELVASAMNTLHKFSGAFPLFVQLKAKAIRVTGRRGL